MLEHPLLSQAAKKGMRLGLERFQSFIRYIGNPCQYYPSCHIAGTNGKGSVTKIMESILTEGGYKTGAFTSPHLVHVNERITINGVSISDEDLESLLIEISEKAKEWVTEEYDESDLVPLTYFELITAVALVYFARQRIDIAVVEVGMGGRFDATSVVVPIVTAIVSISLDHTQILGADLGSIAGEKGGIITPGIPLVTGMLPIEAMRVVRMMVHNRQTQMATLGTDFMLKSNRNGTFDFSFGKVNHSDLELNILGGFQQENSSVALACWTLIRHQFPISEDAIRRALVKVKHRGRLEWVNENVLVDCAHNPSGAIQLAEYLRRLPRDKNRILIFGASEDKDVRAMIMPLVSQVDVIYTSSCRHPRADTPANLAKKLVSVDIPVLPMGQIEFTLQRVDFEQNLIVVAGSVFLVGAVHSLLG